mmetsp:Transcript_10706/g.23705  ORF Transcript_10706/g.23705 Transcript_10706/m.23705 type:complete len:747 (-) Transcript_10706:88-2328(-)|eukprot:CAMPEP_0172312266 /NCGR_PEP_ID=MMETSP1058-20130122/17096_1 /TAXON_ID=83371 /ORGANISM="Detonula confervacea, Strain CCMP 353" /LENGTH=746 /DNA_ID=CAMNT_0013025675 /DNA_START=67 /DNA_END=2307 /DNA_ORIENTATION=-
MTKAYLVAFVVAQHQFIGGQSFLSPHPVPSLAKRHTQFASCQYERASHVYTSQPQPSVSSLHMNQNDEQVQIILDGSKSSSKKDDEQRIQNQQFQLDQNQQFQPESAEAESENGDNNSYSKEILQADKIGRSAQSVLPTNTNQSKEDDDDEHPPLVSSTPEWKRLQHHATKVIQPSHLRDMIQDPSRCNAMYAEHDGVYLDYSRQQATLETMDLLMDLAEKQNLEERIKGMFNGEKINFTEDRAVLHTALRAGKDEIGTVFVDDLDAIKEVHDVLHQIKTFTEAFRSGQITGYTGKRMRNIVSVGIGGSYLGPEFLHEVLKTEAEGINSSLGYSLRFLANVDPVDVERTCADLDPEETLIIVVSKTFTTAETMLNARTMRQWLWDFMGDDIEVVKNHVVACSSVSATENVEAFGIDTDKYFFRFWDWVGGRYSVCGAAGAVPISLLYGFDLFEKFLEGARSMDQHFLNAPMKENIPIIMGLLGVWNSSFMGYNSRALIPYAQALLRLPAHIQQLDMESNGKRINRFGVEIDYPVGEVDFGEPGTNSQHSFFQLIHQGQTIPVDFLGFVQSQHDLLMDNEKLSSHDELMANFFAQPDALANGKTADEVRAEGCPEELVLHKVFDGNRPSSSLLFPQLSAYVTGQILSLYEHRTAVQGFIWDLNSFDQWGVELGKKLALDVKEHLMEARNNEQGDHEITADNPASSRILNYYINNSRDAVRGDLTRKTHKDHFPPQIHDLGGHSGRLS